MTTNDKSLKAILSHLVSIMAQKGHDADKFVEWLTDQEEGLSDRNKYDARVKMFHQQMKKPDIQKRKNVASLYEAEGILI